MLLKRPAISKKKKDQFEMEFKQIMSEAPSDLQKKWSKRITWQLDLPKTNATVIAKLPKALKDRLNSAKSKLRDL